MVYPLRYAVKLILSIRFIPECAKCSFVYKFCQKWICKCFAYIDELRTTPKAKVLLVISWNEFLASIIGVNIFDPKFKRTWLTYWCGVAALNLYTLTIYSAIYFIATGVPTKALAAVCTLGVAIPVSIEI